MDKKTYYILGRVSLISIIILGSACAPTLKTTTVSSEAAQAERQKQLEMAFSLEAQRNDRLLNVSYPLLVAGTELCGSDVGGNYGFRFHNKEAYKEDYREIAARYFGLDDRIAGRYVHPKSPAAAAGLKTGDRILEINGESVEKETVDETAELIRDHLKKSTPPQEPLVLNLKIARGDQVQQISVKGVNTCKYPVVLQNADVVNAFADGNQVVITTGMIRFAESDTELALVVGHEISHNALGHIRKKTVNAIPGMILDVAIGVFTGVRSNIFSNMGSQAFSQQFEAEADYAGLYIAARAGYNLKGAANFWRRMAAEHPGSITASFGASHPSTPERFIAIEQTVKEIAEKRRIGAPLLPEKKETEKKEAAPDKKDVEPVGDR